jgi:hypothetical protein
MEVIKGILQEELENAFQVQKRYREELQRLPKGSLFKRIIGGHLYFYLSFRDGPRNVRQKYLGRLSEKQANEHRAEIEKRRRYEEQLRELKKKISYLRKVLRVKAD